MKNPSILTTFQEKCRDQLQNISLESGNSNDSLKKVIDILHSSAVAIILSDNRPANREYNAEIEELSKKQKSLRLEINSLKTVHLEKFKEKRKERNKILNEIKRKNKQILANKIDDIAKDINNAPDSQRMFKASREILNINP